MLLIIFGSLLIHSCIRLSFLNRPETEKFIAEKFGIGIMNGSTFTLKEHLRDDIEKMCMPKIMQKEIKGIVTHVRHEHV